MSIGGRIIRERFRIGLPCAADPPVADGDVGAADGDFPVFGGVAADELEVTILQMEILTG